MHSNIVHLDRLPAADNEIIWVPDGDYSLRFTGWRTGLYFGKQPKVVLSFKITEFGEYFEWPLERFYNAKRLIGKPGKNGNFQVGRCSDLVRDFARVCPAPIKRLDRIPMSLLHDIAIIGEVETVTKGHDQKEIPQSVQYSKIARLVSAER